LWPTTATFRSAGAEKIFIGGGLYKAKKRSAVSSQLCFFFSAGPLNNDRDEDPHRDEDYSNQEKCGDYGSGARMPLLLLVRQDLPGERTELRAES
jgi:hypothetical protein